VGVAFSLTNPLNVWKVNGVNAIERSPRFAPDGDPRLKDEPSTLAFAIFEEFRAIEDEPHSLAHGRTAGGGWLGHTGTAVQDPLFFLLHANIDRLWAWWQVEKDRLNPASEESYSLQGSTAAGNCSTLGQAALDTMWPWNGATRPTDRCRPATAPGGVFPAFAPGVFVPPQQPRPYDLIDYRGGASSPGVGGVSYDNVPFK